MMLVLGVVWMMGCGGAEPAPQLAPDRTVPGAERGTKVTTCRWVPALPEDREDPCNHDNQGAVLEITERADMREESKTQQSHTCLCN
jgi:hypothetical protein